MYPDKPALCSGWLSRICAISMRVQPALTRQRAQDLHWHMEQYKAQLQVLAEVCGETAYRRLHGAALLSYLHSCASSCLGELCLAHADRRSDR